MFEESLFAHLFIVSNHPFQSNPKLPESMSSPMYWRKSKVVYIQNEIFVDLNETFTAAFGKFYPIRLLSSSFSFSFLSSIALVSSPPPSSLSDGVVITSHVGGAIQCVSKLSGTPDLTMTFDNPGIMDDVSLHPCVRYLRWMQEKIISFVPPDGAFTLAKYRVGFEHHFLILSFSHPLILSSSLFLFFSSSSAAIAPPLSVRPEFLIGNGSAKFLFGVCFSSFSTHCISFFLFFLFFFPLLSQLFLPPSSAHAIPAASQLRSVTLTLKSQRV